MKNKNGDKWIMFTNESDFIKLSPDKMAEQLYLLNFDNTFLRKDLEAAKKEIFELSELIVPSARKVKYFDYKYITKSEEVNVGQKKSLNLEGKDPEMVKLNATNIQLNEEVEYLQKVIKNLRCELNNSYIQHSNMMTRFHYMKSSLAVEKLRNKSD
ncbi:hypothetical protein SNEBB_009808 [Seison nebaliae]|nr:hypothetical protein SNEBB_009808 [Seison nebaliae]